MPRRSDRRAAAARARRREGPRGLALPTVLFMGVVLFLLVTAVAFRSVVGVNQASDQRRYTEALQIADGAIDKGLYNLVEAHAYNTQTCTSAPVAGSCTVADDGLPDPSMTERQWALGKAAWKLPVNGSDPNLTFARLVKSQSGEWALIKPAGEANRFVYAVGYVPSRANATRTRVLRVEYDFPPFNAINAILTGGNLKIGGNASIAGSAGSIHTNGSFDWQGGAWNVTGAVTSVGQFGNGSGSVPNNIGDQTSSGGSKATQDIPNIDPSDPATYNLSQYDLCPDGSVHGGPANTNSGASGPYKNTTSTPCGGPLIQASGTFNGWVPSVGAGSGLTTPTTWKYQSSNCYNGVYFVHLGTVNIQGNPGTNAATCLGQPWRATIMASSKHTTATSEPGCPHYGGDFNITGTPKMAPYDPKGGILFMAGRDFQMKGNASGGGANLQGSISVHEQFDVSGNMTLVGNLIANDQCDTSGSPVSENIVNLQGSSSITFNSPVELPLGKLIRITRWTEL